MGKYVKVIKFNVLRFGYIEFEEEFVGVDKFSDVLSKGEIKSYRDYRGGKVKDSIEKIIEYINGEDIEVGEEVDVFGDENLLLLGIKKEDYDVNKWLKDEWFMCEEVEDVY